MYKITPLPKNINNFEFKYMTKIYILLIVM